MHSVRRIFSCSHMYAYFLPGSQSSIGRTSTSNVPQQTGGVQIFCDENAPMESLPPQTGQWNGFPSKESKKENERSAGVWTQARVSDRLVFSTHYLFGLITSSADP